jgi:methionine-S-sulfoxide reductase
MTLSQDIQQINANALPLDAEATQDTETATLALGCFWSPDAKFGAIPGVVRTRVGYTGGQQENPTYHNLGDHTETVEIDYDPTQISYAELLDIFWQSHNPVMPSWKRQYMSAIFYHNDEQKRLAEKTRDREAEKKGEIHTEIAPLSQFYLAEDYHQKYNLRQQTDLMKEFKAVYNDAEFINSTVAARTNGYVAGYGSLSQLEREIDQFGLSEKATEKLRAIAG